MKIARLAGLMFVAILAMGLVAASAALAAGPEFTPVSSQSINGTSGTAKLSGNNGAETVTCATSASSGTITSSLLAGNIVVHFLSCTSAGKTKTGCAANSTNTTSSGLILTTTLHGILGTISGGGIGLLLLPISGKRFVTLAKNECTAETAVTGTLAGLVEPTGKTQTTGKLTFALNSSGKQAIKSIELTHGLGTVEPELVAFTTTASEEVAEAITFGTATEVT